LFPARRLRLCTSARPLRMWKSFVHRLRLGLLNVELNGQQPVPNGQGTRRHRHGRLATRMPEPKDVVEVIGLPPLLDLISREAPGVRADVRPITPGTPAALQEGAVDLVIGPDLEAKFGARFPGLRTQALSTDDFVCIVREGHPAVVGELDLETFLSLRHVVVTSDPTNDAAIEHAVHRLGRVRDVAAKIAHFMSVPFVVGQSDLVATIPRRMADTFARLARLRVLSPPASLDLPPSELVMSWHERCNEDPANRWLREVAARLSLLVDETCSAGDVHDRPDGVVSKLCSRQSFGPR
jgi:DNA-binding transcriptional LysR family regulator